MAIEWAVISASVIPHIKKYLADRVEKLADGSADAVLAKMYRRIVPDEKLIKANEAFVTRFSRELDYCMDLPTLHAAPYHEALRHFLGNPSVQDALQSPLDAESELDWKLLRGIWNEVHTPDGQRLIELPAEFDWAKVAKTYRQSIQRQMLADPELRTLIQAIASLRTVEAMKRLEGPARAFDLTRYAEALKTAFGYLKLGSLDTDWAQYEGRVHLESVYVPQSVKRALPPRDLTRDYLRLLHEERREQGLDADEELLQRRREEYAQVSPRPLLEVVDDPAYQRLVILGDPGLGKSTLLRHLALRWAENPTGPLTLFLELRRASRASGQASFLDYLEKGADQTSVLPRLELDAHLKSGESLVLFDALDEVPEAGRADAVSDIIRFADDYPKARIIATTRIHGYHPGSTHPERFRDARFEQFTLQDFQDAEIDRFIGLWHRGLSGTHPNAGATKRACARR